MLNSSIRKQKVANPRTVPGWNEQRFTLTGALSGFKLFKFMAGTIIKFLLC